MSQDTVVAKERGGVVNRLDAGKAIAEHESGRAKIHGHECQLSSWALGCIATREASPSKNTSVQQVV